MTKNILSSVLPLIVTIVLFLIVGNFGLSKIKELNSKIASAQKDRSELTKKLNTLRDASKLAEQGSQTVSLVLPSINPALAVIMQLKSLAGQYVIPLTNLKSGTEVKDSQGFSNVTISFDFTAPREGVFALIDAVEKTAPLVVFDKIKLSESGGQTNASITLKTYWAPLPSQLPAIKQSITDLTADEKSTLEKISALTLPRFVELPPSEVGGKANPFEVLGTTSQPSE